MLSLLFWILCAAGIVCLIVFSGRHKKDLPLSDSMRDIASVTFLLAQLVFPFYGYAMHPAGNAYVHAFRPDIKWLMDSVKAFIMNLRLVDVNFNKPEYGFPGNSVYLSVILTAVFCFFAGAALYENGLKIKRKIYLLIPLAAFIAAGFVSYNYRFSRRIRVEEFSRFLVLYLEDGIVRYLFGSLFMIALLYGIYLLLKKLTGKEITALIVILILSFFPPLIRIVNDGMMRRGPELRYMLLGPGIPLFPIGMLVMKYKDRILPKTKKGAVVYFSSWLIAGGVSFYALHGLQKLLLALTGLHISDGYTCMPDENFGRITATLESIYKTECIPWLIFGLSLCMLIFAASRYIRTGNPVTRFFRENCYLITVLLFSRHIFFCFSAKGMRFWTKNVQIPEKWIVLIPLGYFLIATLLASGIRQLEKRVLKD